MATAKIPITYINGQPHIPVTITNPTNKKSVTLNMLVDTGWDVDRVDLKYGIHLDFTPINAIGGAAAKLAKKEYTTHLATLKIGTLQPITSFLYVGSSNTGHNVFGLLPMRQYEHFIITRTHVTATDSTTGGGTPAGLIAATKDFNKYKYVGGVPTLAATTAALAMSLERKGSYRNRI